MPCGTIIWDVETNTKICDITQPNQRICLLEGGRPGLGNLHFKSGRNRAPRQSTLGEPSREKRLRLELRLLADVGLVGLPNAGKSSLIACVSAARPKVADYPFTTLDPKLGVVDYKQQTSFVMADIPGLIEGAASGIGLGDQFLKHISRCRLLLHMIDANGTLESVWHNYQVIQAEIKEYSNELVQKKQIVVLNKSDCLSDEDMNDMVIFFNKNQASPVISASTVTRHHIPDLLDMIVKQLACDD